MPLGVAFGSFIFLLAVAIRSAAYAAAWPSALPWRRSDGTLRRWVVDALPHVNNTLILTACILLAVWSYRLGAPCSAALFIYEMLGMSAMALMGYFYSQERRTRLYTIYGSLFLLTFYVQHFFFLAYVQITDPGLLSAGDIPQLSLPLILTVFVHFTLAALNILAHVQKVRFQPRIFCG